jgi:hypothetical protein
MWASERWVLRAFELSPTVWEAARPDGSGGRVLAYGEAGECGEPLMGDFALGLEEDEGFQVVALSLLEDVQDYKIRGVPLDYPHCVAGENGVVVVTGRYHNQPAVAVFQSGGWQRVLLPFSPSVLEPLVVRSRIIVAAPEEGYRDGQTAKPIPSVGAVYVLQQEGGQWSVRERILPYRPRENGLFGHKVHVRGDRIFINYLEDYPEPPRPVPDQAVDLKGYMKYLDDSVAGLIREGFGEPRFCEASL